MVKSLGVSQFLSWTLLLLFFVASAQSKAPTEKSTVFDLQTSLQAVVHRNDDCSSSSSSVEDVANSKSREIVSLAFISRPFYVGDSNKYLEVRGGSDEEEEGEEQSDDEGEEGSSDQESDGADDEEGVKGEELDFAAVIEKAGSITQSTIIPYTKKLLIGLMKVTKHVVISTTKAVQRAIQAGMEGDEEAEEQDDDEDAEPVPMVQKVLATLQRMVKAALTFPEEDEEVESSGESDADEGDEMAAASKGKEGSGVKAPKKSSSKAKKPSDLGTFLASSYGVKDERKTEGGASVIGGSLSTALLEARAQARLLVIFLPAEKPNKKSSESKDAIAIESILSDEVGEAANQRARSKGEDTGSFLFWGAKAGSSEATTAMKRLKIKAKASKDGKKPSLVVVYAAMVVDSSTGQSKIVPKVVAQHHCSPPPSSSSMASWLNTLRKRHAKQYTAMQTVLKELQYFKERKEGYTESKKSDKEREKREKEEEEKRLAAEKAEQERLEELEKRRKGLKEALPEEPKGKDTKKVALRFADGRSGQRRFSPEQPLTDIFNWVDAMYEIERENVILTTMNGKETFEWEEIGKTLEEAGLGKNTGFRVSIKETNGADNKEST